MTRISIVTPCRNGAAWLAQTLRSALAQTCPPFEIVVVDDGSTDDSRAIAESFGPPVRVVTGAAEGAAVARNRGAELATGERLMFLDADDLLAPQTLGALSNALDAAGGPAVALCPWDRYELEGEAWIARPPTAALPRPRQDRLAAWLTGTWSPPCAILWDRSAFDASGGWLQAAGLDDDGNLMRRALARGVSAVSAPEGLALYRRLPGEAQSYSGKRLEPFGLRARLNALIDTIEELERAGTLPRYRAPLVETLHTLLTDAGHAPEIANEVRAAIARAGGTRPGDAGRAAAERWGARAVAWRRERGSQIRNQTVPAEVSHSNGETSSNGGASTSQRVSVIVPTYNRAAAVERAVASVLAQTHTDLELIVVDDGSTDDTGARLATIADDRLRIVRQDNAGVAAARNRGLREARCDLLAFLDSDDLWRPGKLACQIEALTTAPPSAGLCVTAVEVVGPDQSREIRHSPGGRLFEPLLLTNSIHAVLSSGLIRRAVFEAVGGFDPRLPAIEDWDWLQRAARLFDIVSVDEALTIYADNEDDNRRSRRFRANMEARDMLWVRNRHALTRAGLAHLYLLESARRELREPEGQTARGHALALRAVAARPQERSLWPWVPYSLAPYALRARLRAIDGTMRGV